MFAHTAKKQDGNQVVVEVTSGTGGGKWGRPGFVTLYEFPPDLVVKSIRTKGVTVHERRSVDLRNRGPRSHFGATFSELVRKADELAKANA